MKLASPEWLLLIPALAFAAWRWPELRLARPSRIACVVLFALILARPIVQRAGEGIDLWMLVDRSASAANAITSSLPEWEALITRSKGSDDRLHIVEFAAEPVMRGDSEAPQLDSSETRTALAIQYALTQRSPDRLSRVLLVSDGYSTEPLAPVLEPLIQAGVPLDYRTAVATTPIDFRVDSVELPQRIQNGESFLVEARVFGATDGECPYVVERDGREIGRGAVRIASGEGRVRFTDRLRGTGAHRYAVRLMPAQDAHPENNHAEGWIEISGVARVLAITAYDQDPVVQVLRQNGFLVEQVTDPSRLHPGALSGARLVFLNNVPAHRLPPEFQNALQFYVKEQGGGLLMSGGKFSFGSGGYFSSALDPLLPVSMELRKEHRKLRVALAIVMDRSGSMAVPVSKGGQTVTKMDLANEGAARAVELLGDSDFISVLAVDSEPHRIVPLVEVAQSRSAITDRVRRIESRGGGIFVYEGLKAGWEELQKVDVGQRHLILFSDAADSEEPGAYKRLIDEMLAGGATISVIGLGSDSDSDAGLLQDIALRGKGRMIFNSDPQELPALFAQETVAVARSAFITDPVPVKPTAGWLSFAAKPLQWIEKTDGYNLSYLKEGATAAALSGDEYGAPLVAFWERGLGRTAAVSFPLAGEKSDAARAWPQYSEFVTTLVRWLAGTEAPAGLGLNARMVGTELTVDLYYDDAGKEIAGGEPKLLLSGREADQSRTIPWEKLAPGHFHARASLRPGELVRGAAQVGRAAVPFGPLLAATNAEWQFRREAFTELKTISARTGGQERLDLSTVWETPPQPRFQDLRVWMLALLLGAVVCDAFLTRTGRV